MASSNLCQWSFQDTDESAGKRVADHPELSVTLPDGYAHHLCHFEAVDGGYQAEVRVDVDTELDAQKWVKKYEEQNRVTFRLKNTYPNTGRVNIFKVTYRCHHNTLPRSADQRLSSKNTDCSAQMTVKVKRCMGKKSRAKNQDRHLPAFPMVVNLDFTHNHGLYTADTLKHRDVSEETISNFKHLFSKGHSPSSALNSYKMDLQIEHGPDYVLKAADRAVCPDLQFCHRLYRHVFEKSYGAASGEDMVHDLEALINSYNAEQGVECVKMGQEHGRIAIAACTPLMRRIHEGHKQSGELVFVDASGGMDRYDCRVFLILTHSVAGGLPLGCLVTTSESRETITLALDLYNSIIPERAYFGRGAKGPELFMTDDCEAEKKSLKTAYPEAKQALCVFHILQAVWRYVWEGKHAILREDRPKLLSLVKAMVYAGKEEELDDSFAAVKDDPVASKYANYIAYCERLYSRREECAVCMRADLPFRGNNTNNYVEAAMRVLKDQIFERVRAYSPVQLLDFMLVRMPAYYERRLTDVVNGRFDMFISKRYLPGNEEITVDMISRAEEDGMYHVQSVHHPDQHYEVDMVHAMCTCPVGLNGAPCKHQYAVMKHCKIRSLNFLPIKDEQTRVHLLHLATGATNVPDGWFSPLSGSTELTDPPQAGTPQDIVSPAAELPPPESNGSLDLQRQMQNRFDARHGNVPLNESLEENIRHLAESLICKLHENPAELSGPIKTFIKNYENLKTDVAISSALTTFGKYTGAAQSLSSRKKAKTTGLRRRHGTMIKVQPSAVSRRRTTPVGGRRCLHTGRPKAVEVYGSGKRSQNCQLLPRKRPRRAPHNLSSCVDRNVSIGKTHSAKW